MKDYKYKYEKYKKKYIEMKNKYKSISLYKDDVPKDFKKIPTSGKQNCGIFIKDDVLIKCGCQHKSYDIVSKLNEIYKIFPYLYNVYRSKGKTYCIMEKLDGDLTQLLLKVVPSIVINNFDIKNKNFILDIFEFKLNRKTYEINVDNLESARNNLVKIITKNNYMIDINYNIYNDYIKFMEALISEYKKIFKIIIKQYLMLIIRLNQKGYLYNDIKLDNLGYKLDDEQYEHLGIIWNDNNINSKYLYIYILDFDTGLNKIEEDHIVHFNKKIKMHLDYILRGKGIYGFKDMNYLQQKINLIFKKDDHIADIEFIDNIKKNNEPLYSFIKVLNYEYRTNYFYDPPKITNYEEAYSFSIMDAKVIKK